MSESTSTHAEAAAGTGPNADADKLQWTERVLTDILRLMEVPARLELKDAPPVPMDKGVPGISVAVMLEGGDAPGGPGKRSTLSESLQFLANKIVNRAGTSERRWISIAIGGHPEPKAPAQKKVPPPAPAPVGAAASNGARAGTAAPASQAAAPAPVGRPERGARGKAGAPPPAARAVDESKLEVTPEPVLSALAQGLAQRAGTLGRYYAVVGLSVEERARMLQSCSASPDVTVSVEGEGRARRLVFSPTKPLPMPKRAFPDVPEFDEDEEDDTEE